MKSLIALALFSSLAFAQTGTTTAKKPATSAAKKPATTAKKPMPTQSAVSYPPGFPEDPKDPVAIFDTTAGKLVCELYQSKAPNTVANFIGLAEGTKEWKNPNNGQPKKGVPYYNGTIFHRVIPDFMIQGGDPLGTGEGGPGYQFADEFPPDLHFDKPGRLAMANAGPNTNGSQFFITEVPTPNLNPKNGRGYNLFGQCTPDSVALATKIAQGPCQGQVCSYDNYRADNPVKIIKLTIRKPSSGKPHPAAKTTNKPGGPRPHKTGVPGEPKPVTPKPSSSTPK